MTNKHWIFKESFLYKKQGSVWKVKATDGTAGYFKYVTPRQWYWSGPMVANELISAALARKLGFPVAELQETEIAMHRGSPVRGIVSMSARAWEVIPWADAGEHVFNDPESHVKDTDLLAALIVFDVWITNLDRFLGANLILYRNRPSEMYNWYLIDHGNCLYGSPRKWERGAWNDPLWDRITTSRYTPKGLEHLQTSWPKLEPMIEKIEALSVAEIDEALRSASHLILRNKERAFIRRLLLARQKRLRQMFTDWLSP